MDKIQIHLGDRVLIVIDNKFFILEGKNLRRISPETAAKILLRLLEACHH